MKAGDSIHERVLHYAHTGSNTLYQDFQISEEGYDEEQAAKNREKYGNNTLTGRATDTVFYRLRGPLSIRLPLPCWC